jgi:hypothetical protein
MSHPPTRNKEQRRTPASCRTNRRDGRRPRGGRPMGPRLLLALASAAVAGGALAGPTMAGARSELEASISRLVNQGAPGAMVYVRRGRETTRAARGMSVAAGRRRMRISDTLGAVRAGAEHRAILLYGHCLGFAQLRRHAPEVLSTPRQARAHVKRVKRASSPARPEHGRAAPCTDPSVDGCGSWRISAVRPSCCPITSDSPGTCRAAPGLDSTFDALTRWASPGRRSRALGGRTARAWC